MIVGIQVETPSAGQSTWSIRIETRRFSSFKRKMLQFLVDAQLLNCTLRIPKLRTFIQRDTHEFLIRGKDLIIHYYRQRIDDVLNWPEFVPIAIALTGVGPQLRILSDDGREYTCLDGDTGRGSECFQDYLIEI